MGGWSMVDVAGAAAAGTRTPLPSVLFAPTPADAARTPTPSTHRRCMAAWIALSAGVIL
jgi:hypothetical protein